MNRHKTISKVIKHCNAGMELHLKWEVYDLVSSKLDEVEKQLMS